MQFYFPELYSKLNYEVYSILVQRQDKRVRERLTFCLNRRSNIKIKTDKMSGYMF